MRNFIKSIYKNSTIGYFLIHPVKLLYDIYRFQIIPEKIFIKRRFQKILGYKLNLENPKTFNEKIQWLKLNERKSLHTLCADKYAVREYIKEKIGKQYLVPLLYDTDNPNDIVLRNLPNIPHIIKINHNSGGVVIVKDKTKIDIKRVQKDLKKLLKINYYYESKEWQYKNIKPHIVVEKLLLDKENNIPNDYKFHCFNGEVVFIQVDLDRQTEHKRNLYDPDWNFINCQWKFKNGTDVERPCMLSQMKSLAEVISKDFRYIRVDFYNLGNNIYFGELTFHPESGFGSFIPSKWDRKFGDKLLI